MNVRIASEAWICCSFVQPGESRLWAWISIWISSWGPLKLCDAIRRTTSAPPGQNPAGQDLEASLSRSPSHDSNAPIKPKSQSNLSNIVARLTAIRGCIGSISKLQSRRALDTGRHAVRESGHWQMLLQKSKIERR